MGRLHDIFVKAKERGEKASSKKHFLSLYAWKLAFVAGSSNFAVLLLTRGVIEGQGDIDAIKFNPGGLAYLDSKTVFLSFLIAPLFSKYYGGGIALTRLADTGWEILYCCRHSGYLSFRHFRNQPELFSILLTSSWSSHKQNPRSSLDTTTNITIQYSYLFMNIYGTCSWVSWTKH